MAGINKEEFHPLLPAGFHPLDEAARRRLCVERFPSSITRMIILNNVEQLISSINSQAIKGELWIDGSFLTEKQNPDDADLVFALTEETYRSLNHAQKTFFDTYRSTRLYDRYRIDNYGVVVDQNSALGQWQYAYWLRQFGFSRGNQMKGILQVHVPHLVMP